LVIENSQEIVSKNSSSTSSTSTTTNQTSTGTNNNNQNSGTSIPFQETNTVEQEQQKRYNDQYHFGEHLNLVKYKQLHAQIHSERYTVPAQTG